MCRWVLKTDLRMAVCFSLDMLNTGVFEKAPPGSESGPGPGLGSASEPDGEGTVDPSSNSNNNNNSNSPPHWVLDEMPSERPDSPQARLTMLRQMTDCVALESPPPPGPMSRKFAAEVLPDVNVMMHASQR